MYSSLVLPSSNPIITYHELRCVLNNDINKHYKLVLRGAIIFYATVNFLQDIDKIHEKKKKRLT